MPCGLCTRGAQASRRPTPASETPPASAWRAGDGPLAATPRLTSATGRATPPETVRPIRLGARDPLWHPRTQDEMRALARVPREPAWPWDVAPSGGAPAPGKKPAVQSAAGPVGQDLVIVSRALADLAEFLSPARSPRGAGASILDRRVEERRARGSDGRRRPPAERPPAPAATHARRSCRCWASWSSRPAAPAEPSARGRRARAGIPRPPRAAPTSRGPPPAIAPARRILRQPGGPAAAAQTPAPRDPCRRTLRQLDRHRQLPRLARHHLVGSGRPSRSAAKNFLTCCPILATANSSSG